MKKYLLFMIIMAYISTGYSQQDSIIVQKVNRDTMDEHYDRVYKLFIKDEDKEIKHLWKINIVDLGLLMPNLGFEQRISKWWSYDGYVKFGIDWWDNYSEFISKWEVNQLFKFYYNVNRRERLGRKTNGFTGNYISIGLTGGEKRNPKPDLHNGTVTDACLFYGVNLSYGLQRRIGNIGYFELIGGINYQYQNQSEYKKNAPLFDFSSFGESAEWRDMPIVMIKAGFAIDSFVKRGKILK